MFRSLPHFIDIKSINTVKITQVFSFAYRSILLIESIFSKANLVLKGNDYIQVYIILKFMEN